MGLNPYSNGICSLTNIELIVNKVVERLNPYSNGICSLTAPYALNGEHHAMS